MDFNSLGENSPVYIIRKKPFQFVTGTMKSKSQKQAGGNPFLPQPTPQTVDVVVTVGGSDEILPGIPVNMETVEYRGSYYSVTSEGAQQAIANMMQMASKGKEEQEYYDSILSDGEKYIEQLNPQYAEGKRQARVVRELQERADAQDKKLDQILTFMKELSGPSRG